MDVGLRPSAETADVVQSVQLLSVLGEKPVYDSEEPTEWNSQDVVESDRTECRTGLHDGAGREGERPANQSARVTEIPVGRHEAEAAGGLESEIDLASVTRRGRVLSAESPPP